MASGKMAFAWPSTLCRLVLKPKDAPSLPYLLVSEGWGYCHTPYIIAPVARAAANEAADKVISKISQLLPEIQQTIQEDPFMTRHARCEKVWESNK